MSIALEPSISAKLILLYLKAYIKAMLLKLIEHSLRKYTPLFIISLSFIINSYVYLEVNKSIKH